MPEVGYQDWRLIYYLELEISKYTIVTRQKRLCKLCNLDQVEDEAHLLFSCSLLQMERSGSYVQHIEVFDWFLQLTDMEKNSYLMCKVNVKKLELLVDALPTKRHQIMFKAN